MCFVYRAGGRAQLRPAGVEDCRRACRFLRVCAKYRLLIQNRMDGLFTSGAIKNGGEKFSPG